MEIIDRPLSEIIKEQKIGESLRKNRRGGARGGQQNTRSNRNGGAGAGARNGRRFPGRGGARVNDIPGRRRLRLRGSGPSPKRLRFADRGTNDRLSRRRHGVDFGDESRNRSVKSFSVQRRRVPRAEENDRVRALRRREALRHARSRFS